MLRRRRVGPLEPKPQSQIAWLLGDHPGIFGYTEGSALFSEVPVGEPYQVKPEEREVHQRRLRHALDTLLAQKT